MKRIGICCVCLLLLIVTGCQHTAAGRSSDTPTAPGITSEKAPDILSLAYNREDTLDPFSATTQLNVYLSCLLYEPLVRPDAAFSPQNVLAGTVQQPDLTHLTVTLKKAKFSDGTTVTADDVVYSFNKAKASAQYATALSNISAVSKQKGTLSFTLASPDPYAAVCLYFPIIKRASDTKAKAAAAIGTGPYVYHADTETLVLNSYHTIAQTAQNKTIRLQHAVNRDSVLQNLENGTVHCMFVDLSDGNIPRTAAKDMAVDLPQLVYIGVNTAKPALATPSSRAALSAAIDRTVLAASCYAGRALPATSPFHPKWKPALDLHAFSAGSVVTQTATTATTPATTAPAAAVLSDATTAQTTAPADAALSLIYPAGNRCREAAVKMIVQQLTHAGIAVSATALSYTEYHSRLQTGDFDIYLGEIRLTPNMNLSVFFRAGSDGAYGVPTAGAAAQSYAAFRAGTATVSAFITAFGEEMPYIPLCWRQGMAACHTAISYITPSAFAVYDGITH